MDDLALRDPRLDAGPHCPLEDAPEPLGAPPLPYPHQRGMIREPPGLEADTLDGLLMRSDCPRAAAAAIARSAERCLVDPAAEGLKPPKLARSEFRSFVDAALEDPALEPALGPLVRLIDQLEREVAGLDRRIAAAAKANEVCRLLMTVPGVGPLVALTYAAGIDDPTRFAKSRNVGVHFGLTPRRWQSGETDWSGGISRAGDASVRRALYQAANVLIHHSRGWCALKAWAVRLAKRRGLGKAKVALARKLAVVLHRMWLSGEPYRIAAT